MLDVKVVAALFIALFTSLDVSASRMVVFLDGGITVTVDNLSNYPESVVQTLVHAADRSTKDGCPFDPPDIKGLISKGDRVVITDNYVAWLDLSAEGSSPGLPSGWARSGALAGYWSLNPSTRLFRNLTSAGSSNCWNWPRNELIPGSASPTGIVNWWDKYSPPIEHVLVAEKNSAGQTGLGKFFAFHYSQLSPSAAWQAIIDGETIVAGQIRFLFAARMANGEFSTTVRHADYPRVC